MSQDDGRGNSEDQSGGKDITTKIQRCGCLLVFVGEFLSQASPANGSYGYTLSAEAIEGFSYLCIDMGFDLLSLNK